MLPRVIYYGGSVLRHRLLRTRSDPRAGRNSRFALGENNIETRTALAALQD